MYADGLVPMPNKMPNGDGCHLHTFHHFLIFFCMISTFFVCDEANQPSQTHLKLYQTLSKHPKSYQGLSNIWETNSMLLTAPDVQHNTFAMLFVANWAKLADEPPKKHIGAFPSRNRNKTLKQPGGWETALVVVNVLKKNCYGAVAPYAFL